MKSLLLTLLVCLLFYCAGAQENCKLIENADPTLTKVSYQTVFVTVVEGKDKFNIKFWKFANKFSISCFVITKDTFCVDQTSTVYFDFTDGQKFNFASDKRQNCRGEVNKDYKENQMPDQTWLLWSQKISAIHISGIRTTKRFAVSEKIATDLQNAFHCIVEKKIL